jgi:predicted transcriptional regulator
MILSFADLMQWCTKRQKYLEWTNHVLAEKSKVPLGTINRIKAGEYADCKYSTIRNILIALIGGTTDEFPCTDLVEKELRQVEQLEQQTARLAEVETENACLKEQLSHIDELHRQDVRAVRAEYQNQISFLQDQISFLKEQLKAWQTAHK